MENKYSRLFAEFSLALADTLKPKEIFSVSTPSQTDPRHTIPDIFAEIPYSLRKTFLELNFDEGTFDLITGNLPLNMRAKQIGSTTFKSSDMSWELIHKLSTNLSAGGYGIFMMSPIAFGGSRGKAFLQRMNGDGVFVYGYINLPENILQPVTSIRPILVVTHKNPSVLRLCSLDAEKDMGGLLEEFFNAKSDFKLIDVVEHKQFNGFHSFEISKQIERLETRYKDFVKVKLADFIESFSLGRKGQTFEDFPNSVYFKILGNNSDIITAPHELSGRAENFLQVRLKDTLSNEYLKIFFKSTIGELIIKSAVNSSFFPRLNREFLFETEIPIPDISVQKQVIETMVRMGRLENQIEQFKKQMSLNPLSDQILSKIDSMLEISDELSAEDKIKSMVLQGESEVLEFKQTFQHCLRLTCAPSFLQR